MATKRNIPVAPKGPATAKLAVGLVLALFVGTACWPFSDDSELAEMTVKREQGQVVVLRQGETIEVKDEASLEPHDIVQTENGGSAIVRLEGGRLLTLQPSARIRIKDPRTVESQRGSILVDTREPIEVAFGDVLATTSRATMRVDRGVSAARMASYRGNVTISAPGEERLQLTSLFEASASAANLPSEASPYDMDESDPWDRRYLEHVVSLQEQLDQLSAGLAIRIGNQRPGLGYFGALSDTRDVGFMKPYLSRTPVNLLLGFTIASHDDKPLATAFREAFSLYDRGAEWAMAGAIMKVKLNAVLSDLEDIASVAVASVSSGDASFTAETAALSEAGELPTDPPDDGSPIDPPNPPPTDPPGTPAPTDDPDPPDECTNFATCTVNDVVEPSPTPTPSDPPDDPPDDGPLDILKGVGGLN